MSSQQLEDAMEAAMHERIADEIGITLEVYDELAPNILQDDPNYVVLEFSEDSPKDLLEMVDGLGDGQYSLRIPAYVLEDHDYMDYDELEWMYSSAATQPYGVFVNSYSHLTGILGEYGEHGNARLAHSASIIRRMVLAQVIVSLEVYLGDTLLKAVMKNQDAIIRLIAEDKVLAAKTFPLSEIAQKDNFVHETVHAHLESILYHNLVKVSIIYKIALKVDIWPSKDIKNTLYAAVKMRHDCVHRDGRTKEGEELTITQAYVSSILEATHTFVKHIKNELDALEGF
ncbi:hypothetical protein [Janthinobacterium lividum]|jgi:hypothetical protein